MKRLQMQEFTEAGERGFSPDPESLQYIQLQPAVDACSASFTQLFSAHYCAYFTSDRKEARTWHYYYKRLLPEFVEANGRIIEQFHAPCPASAYLTEKGREYRLFVAFWPDYLAFDSLPAQVLLGQMIDLRDEATQYLHSVQQRRIVLQKLFMIATELIATIASEWQRHRGGSPGTQASTDVFRQSISHLTDRLDATRKFYVDWPRNLLRSFISTA
ncbi:MAG: hypothetical protein M3Z75_13680 [Actinomycetota bacterium]|nr:hypothetical protein [Actinomycetota bacterium]